MKSFERNVHSEILSKAVCELTCKCLIGLSLFPVTRMADRSQTSTQVCQFMYTIVDYTKCLSCQQLYFPPLFPAFVHQANPPPQYLSSMQHQSPAFSRRQSEQTDRNVELKSTVLFRTTLTH